MESMINGEQKWMERKVEGEEKEMTERMGGKEGEWRENGQRGRDGGKIWEGETVVLDVAWSVTHIKIFTKTP